MLLSLFRGRELWTGADRFLHMAAENQQMVAPPPQFAILEVNNSRHCCTLLSDKVVMPK